MLNGKQKMFLQFVNYPTKHEIEVFEIFDFAASLDMLVHFKNRQQMEEILRQFDEVKEEPRGTLKNEDFEIYGNIYVYHTSGNRGKIHINTNTLQG